MSLKNIEIHINNNNLLKDGIIEFQKISEDMSGKSRKLSEELKVLAPSSTFPIIDDFVDFYSDSSGNPMGDMEVSDLRDAITGICKGIVPVTVFEEKLATLIIKNEALYERILKLSQDPQIVPIKEAIEKQKETLVRIKNYSVNKDKEYLVKGLEDLKERPDCLEKANEVISLKEMEENFITCFRCLEINSTDLQFCKRCKAVLITEVDS